MDNFKTDTLLWLLAFLTVGLCLMLSYYFFPDAFTPIDKKSEVKQEYKSGFLYTYVIYDGIVANEAMDHIDLNSNDSIKLLRYNTGLLLIEKYRRIDSVSGRDKSIWSFHPFKN